MQVSAPTQQAFETIAARARDVQQAFTAGARPAFDDVTSGRRVQTVLDPLCAAPPDGAYFLTIDGRGRTVYTGDGAFSVRDGVLAGADGRPILGFTAPGAALGELHVDPVDAALGRASDLRVEPDGSVTYGGTVIDPRTGARESRRASIGRIALARFPAATKLGVADANHFLAPPGVVPHVGTGGDGSFGLLSPMQRETSRIDLDVSLERLHDAYAAFDALAAANKAKGGLGKTAMDLVK
jgi:flagellar basal body rod protein FlgG